MMNSEQNERLKQLLADAHELAPQERAAFLAQACADDDELRREAESLLAFAEPGASLLDRTAWKAVAGEIVEGDVTALLDKTIGHYRIQSLLGAGGMGQVFLALDTRLGRQVAIKFLPSHFTANAERVRRFEQEARAASALNHPNIITIHEIGEQDGLHFIVMEHVVGQTLRQRLQAGKLSSAEAVDIAAQVANALAAAHHAGIVHRDIKPENIMLRHADGKVKVLDFGIAKLGEGVSDGEKEGKRVGAQEGTATTEVIATPTLPFSPSFTRSVSTALGTVLGTVNYMSPEQARGEALTGQSDVFSLGQVLLEMVRGESLFAGQAAQEVLQQLRSGREVLATADKLDGVPKAVAAIIRRALQREMTARYRSAQAMLEDLTKIQQRAATKWLRRGVAVGISGVLLLLLSLLLAAWFSVQETWPETVLCDGHKATVMQTVFSPDGQRLVSVSRDHSVIVWDFVRREQIKKLADHQGNVNTVAYSPDGKWFATGSDDTTVIVWDATTLQRVTTLHEHRGKVMAVAFSPDGKWLASASGTDTTEQKDFRTLLWAADSWQLVRSFPEGRTYGNLLFSPDSRLLKTNNAQWEVTTGKRVTTEADQLGLSWNVFAPGARQLLGVAAGGVALRQLAQPGVLRAAKLTRDFKEEESPHQDYVRAAAYSPDGKFFATASDNIVLWDAATTTIAARFVFESSVWNVTFSPDGRWLVSSHGDGTILVWNVAQRRREFSFNAHAEAVRAVAFAPDGQHYASAGDDHAILLWNAATGQQEAALVKHQSRVVRIAFSPDGRWLVSLDQQRKLIRWNLASRAVAWETTASNTTSCLAISPDGKWIMTPWFVADREDGHEVFRWPDKPTDAAAFLPDGKRLIGLQSHEVVEWATASWREQQRLSSGDAPLIALSLSADGKQLVTGNRDGALQLWATTPLRLLGRLGNHTGQVSSVSFSADGALVASTGADKTIKLWEVRTSRLLREIGTHAAPVAAVAFAPQGNILLTGEQDRSVRVYQQHRTLWGWELTERSFPFTLLAKR
ncbi:MAG: serine/threonine-protein kinase [Blastocatellia bacterium]